MGIFLDGQISCLLIIIVDLLDYSVFLASFDPPFVHSFFPSILPPFRAPCVHPSLPSSLPSSVLLSFVYICVYLFIARLANHETKEDEEVAREQPVMARPVM